MRFVMGSDSTFDVLNGKIYRYWRYGANGSGEPWDPASGLPEHGRHSPTTATSFARDDFLEIAAWHEYQGFDEEYWRVKWDGGQVTEFNPSTEADAAFDGVESTQSPGIYWWHGEIVDVLKLVSDEAAVVLDEAAVVLDEAVLDEAAVVLDEAAVVLDEAAVVLDEAAVVLDEAAVVLDEAAVVLDEAAVVSDEVTKINWDLFVGKFHPSTASAEVAAGAAGLATEGYTGEPLDGVWYGDIRTGRMYRKGQGWGPIITWNENGLMVGTTSTIEKVIEDGVLKFKVVAGSLEYNLLSEEAIQRILEQAQNAMRRRHHYGLVYGSFDPNDALPEAGQFYASSGTADGEFIKHEVYAFGTRFEDGTWVADGTVTRISVGIQQADLFSLSGDANRDNIQNEGEEPNTLYEYQSTATGLNWAPATTIQWDDIEVVITELIENRITSTEAELIAERVYQQKMQDGIIDYNPNLGPATGANAGVPLVAPRQRWQLIQNCELAGRGFDWYTVQGGGAGKWLPH